MREAHRFIKPVEPVRVHEGVKEENGCNLLGDVTRLVANHSNDAVGAEEIYDILSSGGSAGSVSFEETLTALHKLVSEGILEPVDLSSTCPTVRLRNGAHLGRVFNSSKPKRQPSKVVTNRTGGFSQ